MSSGCGDGVIARRPAEGPIAFFENGILLRRGWQDTVITTRGCFYEKMTGNQKTLDFLLRMLYYRPVNLTIVIDKF